MRVVLFSRRPRPGKNFSIELIVSALLDELRGTLNPTLSLSRFQSNGAFRRLYNAVEAACRQGDVNHVTGDVHFLTYFLRPERTVLTVHDCGRIAGTLDWRKRLIRELWFRIPARRSAVITVVSETVKRELLTHVAIPADRVQVIPSFAPKFYRRFDRPFNVRRPTILHVGTAPNKNLMRLADALNGLPCRLWIVGVTTPEQSAKLKENKVEYETFVSLPNERMLQLYVDCDVVAFASTFEGFGMPIIEANLVGRPVVTSCVASMPEVAAGAACLVDPFDPASIRAGIERVIHDEAYRTELVARGFENALRFRPEAIAKRYADLYRVVHARAALPPVREGRG